MSTATMQPRTSHPPARRPSSHPRNALAQGRSRRSGRPLGARPPGSWSVRARSLDELISCSCVQIGMIVSRQERSVRGRAGSAVSHRTFVYGMSLVQPWVSRRSPSSPTAKRPWVASYPPYGSMPTVVRYRVGSADQGNEKLPRGTRLLTLLGTSFALWGVVGTIFWSLI